MLEQNIAGENSDTEEMCQSKFLCIQSRVLCLETKCEGKVGLCLRRTYIIIALFRHAATSLKADATIAERRLPGVRGRLGAGGGAVASVNL